MVIHRKELCDDLNKFVLYSQSFVMLVYTVPALVIFFLWSYVSLLLISGLCIHIYSYKETIDLLKNDRDYKKIVIISVIAGIIVGVISYLVPDRIVFALLFIVAAIIPHVYINDYTRDLIDFCESDKGGEI